MAEQYFISVTTRKAAEKEVRARISKHNRENPKSKRIQLKSLKKHKSILKGGNPFYLGTVIGKRK